MIRFIVGVISICFLIFCIHKLYDTQFYYTNIKESGEMFKRTYVGDVVTVKGDTISKQIEIPKEDVKRISKDVNCVFDNKKWVILIIVSSFFVLVICGFDILFLILDNSH